MDLKEDQIKMELEMEKMKAFVEHLDDKNNFTMDDFTNSQARAGLFIGFWLCVLIAFNGNLVFSTYSSNIFRDSGSTMDSSTSTIIMGTMQFCGCICSTVFVDKIGRRKLLIISTLMCAIPLTAFGFYNFYAIKGFDVQIINWCPVVCLSIAAFSSCSGIVSICIILLPELLPAKIRHICSKIGFGLMQIFFYIAISSFPLISYTFELYVTLWGYAIICILGFFCAIFCIKDTTGKDLHRPD